MAEIYLKKLRAVLKRVPLDRAARDRIECKHFFSGAAAYCSGNIFMTLTPAGLALKLPEEDRFLLLQQGGRPLRYFPKAPIKKDYVVLPDDFFADIDAVAHWVQRSLAFLH